MDAFAHLETPWVSFSSTGAPRWLHSDFVCLTQRLIVEVDGGQHNLDDYVLSDRERDRHFEGQGFKTLRLWNSDVDDNLWGVLETIDRELRARTAPTPALRADPPPAGEG